MSTKNVARSSQRKLSFGELYSKYGTIVILLLVCIAGCLLSPNFLTPTNLMNVLRQNTYLLVMAFGAMFVMLVGCINIAYDKEMALTGCCAANAYLFSGGNLAFTLLVSILVGVLLEYVYGTLVTRLELPPFIVGLAVSTVAQGIVMTITGGMVIRDVMNTSFTWFGAGHIGGKIPVAIVITAAVMAAAWYIHKCTRYGRHAVATGGNRSAAIAAGIQVDSVVRKAYIISGVTLGIASTMFMSRLGAGQPDPGSGYGFDAMTGVIIGGASLSGGSGGAFGSFVGVMIVGVLNNIMNLLGLNTAWQAITKGILIIIAVVIDMKTKQAIVDANMANA